MVQSVHPSGYGCPALEISSSGLKPTAISTTAIPSTPISVASTFTSSASQAGQTLWGCVVVMSGLAPLDAKRKLVVIRIIISVSVCRRGRTVSLFRIWSKFWYHICLGDCFVVVDSGCPRHSEDKKCLDLKSSCWDIVVEGTRLWNCCWLGIDLKLLGKFLLK